MSEKSTKENKQEKFIDIKKVFKDKNPTLYKLIPSFVINYLRRVVHEDQLNDFVSRHRDEYGLDFVDAIIRDFNANVHVEGLERISKDERYLVASNHPLGGLDGIAFMHVLGRVRQDLVFPVNDLLMNIENLRPLFIPINKHGSNAENIRIINETFGSDKLLLYFPAGLVSRKQKGGVIRDIPWKKTFLSKAKRFKRHVIPVHINGRNTNFFYKLANLRKRLKIKANIEMLYLVDETYKQYDKDIDIIISEPVDYHFFDRRHKDAEWALMLQDYVYELPSGETKSFVEWYNQKNK